MRGVDARRRGAAAAHRAWPLVAALIVAGTALVSTPAQHSPSHAQEAQSYVPEGRVVFIRDLGGLSTGLRTCPRASGEDYFGGCDFRELTDDQSDIAPSWSPTGRHVAFSRQIGDHSLIHVIDVATGEILQLTQPAVEEGVTVTTHDLDPDWSPDGRTIVFARAVDGLTESKMEIAFVDFRGGPFPQVTTIPHDYDDSACQDSSSRRNPSYSPDGSQIAYEASWFLASPSSRRPLSAAVAYTGSGLPLAQGACNPNGVYISSPTSHDGEWQLAPQLGNAIGPDWAPDGLSIAVSADEGTGYYANYVVPLDGRAPILLKDTNGAAPTGPGNHVAWDPGGEFLIADVWGEPVKYRPDGSGDLDTEAGTLTTLGLDVQCLPDDCLTAVSIVKEVQDDGSFGAHYPAIFDYSGDVVGQIEHTGDPFAQPGEFHLWRKIRPGDRVIAEAHHPDWRLVSIVCDHPHEVDLASRAVAIEVPAGAEVLCTFTSVAGPSDAVVPTAEPVSMPPERCSGDADGDGYCNELEVAHRTDPRDGASYPVTPPGYWDTRDRMAMAPPPDCAVPDSGINPCELQAGDILVWRYNDLLDPFGDAERFLGDTYYTHSLLVIGFFDMVKTVKDELDLVVVDITPNPTNRAEMALSTFAEVAVRGPVAMAVYRPYGTERSSREGAARRALDIAWRLGAGDPNKRTASIWNAPDARYSFLPDGWGPDEYYCSSLIAHAYGRRWDDFRTVPRIRAVREARLASGLGDAFYVTPDDLLEGLPGMRRIAGYGSDGLGFSLWSPANLLLTDPQGRRTGRDAEGNLYDEIPGALWRLNDDNESVSAPDVTDDWTLTVSGTGSGTYHLLSHSIAETGSESGVVEAQTERGKIDVYRVADIPFSGSTPGGDDVRAEPQALLPLAVLGGGAALLAAAGVVAMVLLRRRRRRQQAR